MRLLGALAAGVLAAAGLVALGTAPAAAVVTVSTEAQFRAAWADASETQITLANSIGFYNCAAGEPTRNSATALTIVGNSHSLFTGCLNFSVLRNNGTGPIGLQSLTIWGGSRNGGSGGGIYSHSSVTLADSQVTGNTAADSGGGIYTDGTVTLKNSSVANNRALAGSGGGIYAHGVILAWSTVAANTAADSGGGILSTGDVALDKSTLSGNHADSGAGGIVALGGAAVTVKNSTVNGNSSAGNVGAIFNAGPMTLVYATVADNHGTLTQLMFFGLSAFGSVVAPRGGSIDNCYAYGAEQSNGYNFSDDASCGFIQPTDRQNAGDPALRPLQPSSGTYPPASPTATRTPYATSPLIDRIPAPFCQSDGAAGVTNDQRFVARPQGQACDIGSVDVTGPGYYTALTPARVLDTRTSIGGHPSPLGPGQRLDLPVTNAGGVPASGVTAVVLNVTVTNTSTSSYLTVWPTGQNRPAVSNLNWTAGRTIPNLVQVGVGAGGKVSFFNSAGSVDVIADVVGWYSNGPATGGGYSPLAPARVLDTRTAEGGHPFPLGSGQSFDLTVAGMGAAVPGEAKAVALNFTVTDTTAASYLTVWPQGQPRPVASNLNWAPGVTIPNLVVVKLPANGVISIYNNAGSTNVIADVVGWYSQNSATGHGFVSFSPWRVFDTRTPQGNHQFPLGPGQQLDVYIPGPEYLGPATAVVVNVTVTNTTASSYLTVWPKGQPRPLASNLNWGPGLTIPNLVMVGVGTGSRVSIYNNAGNTDVVVDWQGVF